MSVNRSIKLVSLFLVINQINIRIYLNYDYNFKFFLNNYFVNFILLIFYIFKKKNFCIYIKKIKLS
jgi:hypothetical protein